MIVVHDNDESAIFTFQLIVLIKDSYLLVVEVNQMNIAPPHPPLDFFLWQ